MPHVLAYALQMPDVTAGLISLGENAGGRGERSPGASEAILGLGRSGDAIVLVSLE